MKGVTVSHNKYTGPHSLESEKPYTFAAVAPQQQQAIIRMMSMLLSHTAEVCPPHANPKLSDDGMLLRHTDYSFRVRDKPPGASTQSCNYKFSAISRYISEMVQASTKVTIECEYEVICDLSIDVISSDSVSANWSFKVTVLFKGEFL